MDNPEHEQWKEIRDSGLTLELATLEDILRELMFRKVSVVYILPTEEPPRVFTRIRDKKKLREFLRDISK